MCEFHESTCDGFGDIWWTDNPIYFSSIVTQCGISDAGAVSFVGRIIQRNQKPDRGVR